MGERSNVDDLSYLDATLVHETDSGLATVAGTLNVSFHFTKTEVESDLGAILCCHLSSVRSVLL